MSLYRRTDYDLKEESATIDEKLKEQEAGLREEIIKTDKELKAEEEKKRLAALEGDLRENAGYQTASENVARLNVEMRNLHAKETAFKNFSMEYESSGYIGLGTTVHIQFDGRAMAIKLVPSDLGDSSIRAVSIESPLGKALVGKTVGEEVAVKTQARSTDYTIVDIY